MRFYHYTVDTGHRVISLYVPYCQETGYKCCLCGKIFKGQLTKEELTEECINKDKQCEFTH